MQDQLNKAAKEAINELSPIKRIMISKLNRNFSHLHQAAYQRYCVHQDRASYKYCLFAQRGIIAGRNWLQNITIKQLKRTSAKRMKGIRKKSPLGPKDKARRKPLAAETSSSPLASKSAATKVALAAETSSSPLTPKSAAPRIRSSI